MDPGDSILNRHGSERDILESDLGGRPQHTGPAVSNKTTPKDQLEVSNGRVCLNLYDAGVYWSSK